MNHPSAYSRHIEEINLDLQAYGRLAQMFEAQFVAALRLDAARLARSAEEIAQEVALLDARRHARGEAGEISSDAGRPRTARPRPAGGAAPAAIPAAKRALLDERRKELAALVARCSARAVRNGNLLASQFEMLHHLLHGEKHTYVRG